MWKKFWWLVGECHPLGCLRIWMTRWFGFGIAFQSEQPGITKKVNQIIFDFFYLFILLIIRIIIHSIS